MKPQLLKILRAPDHSFSIRHDIIPRFHNKWHYHPELELIYIIKGTGRQFIGDNIHHFKPGDMILMGSNLPHFFRSDEKYQVKNSRLKVETIVLHFMEDFLGPEFFELPEHKYLRNLFSNAQQAVRVKNNTRDQVAEWLRQLLDAKHGKRIILLLEILHTIAHSRQTKPVCSKGLLFEYNPAESDRLNAIYQYIFDNFSREITLEQVAGIAHISPHSFCRYFKSKINKTFSRFLLEVRTGHAAKLLAETDKSVAEICFQSGFNNFSNFNRHFKEIIGRTPLAHRKYYQEIRAGV